MSEEIPDWCFEEGARLVNEEHGSLFWSKRDLQNTSAGRALARLIHKTQKPPVDPLVLATREICALMAVEWGNDLTAKYYRAGGYDNHPESQKILKRLQAIKEGRP